MKPAHKPSHSLSPSLPHFPLLEHFCLTAGASAFLLFISRDICCNPFSLTKSTHFSGVYFPFLPSLPSPATLGKRGKTNSWVIQQLSFPRRCCRELQGAIKNSTFPWVLKPLQQIFKHDPLQTSPSKSSLVIAILRHPHGFAVKIQLSSQKACSKQSQTPPNYYLQQIFSPQQPFIIIFLGLPFTLPCFFEEQSNAWESVQQSAFSLKAQGLKIV